MKVLFAVSNENISNLIIKKYQQMYKEIITSKNVYYFNAILKELQKDKTYDRIVISEDLEPFANNNYETIDNFIFEKLDSISDEASTNSGEDIPIILITTDRRTKSDNLLVKLFGIGVYSSLIGQDRSIDEVCRLINKPRSKKEAKVYYNIDSNEVEYKSENEGNVSESEIQNILTHYKRLGKNEERYVESFDSIANQYTDQQLRVIIKFLPLNVKAVLEGNSPRYQQLISFGGERIRPNNTGSYQSTSKNRTKINNNTNEAINNSGIKIESIKSENPGRRPTKPVIIPSELATKNVNKVNIKSKTNPAMEELENIEDIVEKRLEPINSIEPIQKIDEVESQMDDIVNQLDAIINEEPKKKGRGRPKKVQTEEEVEKISQAPKRGRGRPKKAQVEEAQEDNFVNLFGLDDNKEDKEELTEMLPGFDDIDEENIIPGFEEEQIETLPGFEDYEEQEDETILPGFDTTNNSKYYDSNENYVEEQESRDVNPYRTTTPTNLENLLTRDKKIVAFVGTSKNGTSFLVNNLAEMLSNQGIRVAILDLTKNRNAYYIYTKNEEELRRIAFSCTENLSNGIAQGIQVNKNLDVYTSLPGEDSNIEQCGEILSTLVKNYSLVLLDCDFASDYAYLKESQEIYLVQSMDVLTIQPLTAYLRELKAKGILDQSKLRIVVNKYVKVRNVTEKTIIGGMAFYNDPAMSFMTELFNRETIKYTVIPLEVNAYSKYLEGLINCNISLNGYSKEIISAFRKLSNMVYPLINTDIPNNNKVKYNNPKYNKYANNTNTFSNDMNSTLDKMKRDF